MFARCRMASRTGSQWRSSQPRVVRTGSLRTQSARHRDDHGTICGRSCANSGHCKPLCACVDRTKFVAPASVGGPAHAMGLQIQVLLASNDSEIDAVFEAMPQHRIDALLQAADPFLDTRRDKLVGLVARQ